MLTNLTVVDWRDEPVADAQVIVLRREEPGGATIVFRGRTDAAGRLSVPPQIGNPIDISVLPPPSRGDVCSKAQVPWISERVALPRGFVISGEVRDAAGRLVSAEILFSSDLECGWVQYPTTADGTFTLPPVAYGLVSIAAVSEEFLSSGEEPQWMQVTPEDPRVSLSRQDTLP